jgi:hypothetical protein
LTTWVIHVVLFLHPLGEKFIPPFYVKTKFLNLPDFPPGKKLPPKTTSFSVSKFPLLNKMFKTNSSIQYKRIT